MGITTALYSSGQCSVPNRNMYKLLTVSCLVAVVAADADPGYVAALPALYNSYPNWPGVSTPYGSSTCFGCRPAVHLIGKRSADAEPGYLAYGAYGYGYPRAYGYGLHGLGVAGHPGLATSFVARSPQGLGKRSADAEPGYGLYGYGVPLGLPYNGAIHGISQLHPTGHSFQHVARGKRSADADAEAYYGYYGHPYAYAHHGYGYAHHGYGYGHGYGYYG